MSQKRRKTIYQSLEKLESSEAKVLVPKGEERTYAFSYFGEEDVELDLKMEIEEGAHAEVLGVVYNAGGGSVDLRTESHHTGRGGTADVLIKAVVDGDSSFNYEGMIKIEEEAQQTNSYLSNYILLLSDKARANTIPSLEIEADDVKASHGATVGQVDKEQIFYLMSRGLPKEDSKNIIIKGFLASVIEKINDDEIKKNLLNNLENVRSL